MATTAGWYNDSEFSDLTLKLSDDREILVHKLVICKNNEYFRKLCGPDSRFAESQQKSITLKEDDPDAVEEVLRKIYGCTLPAAQTKGWRFWFNLIITADKYLEADLILRADERLCNVAMVETDADVVFDVMQAIKSDMSHSEKRLAFAERLRKNHLKKLLKNERYRALLVSDKNLMLSQLDELEVPKALVEKTYYLCTGHSGAIFSNGVKEVFTSTPNAQRCYCCSLSRPGNPVATVPSRTAYLPT